MRGGKRRDELRKPVFCLAGFDICRDRTREAPEQVEVQDLAAEKIHRLDAVGALVDLGNAHVAHMLFLAIGADEAVAAQHLHAEIGNLRPAIGEDGLHHRCHQRNHIIGALADGCIRVAFRDIQRLGRPQRQHAAAFSQRPLCQQHAAHVRVDDDGICRLPGIARA
jgi:hypothetical protein